jgi:hypothetical protein
MSPTGVLVPSRINGTESQAEAIGVIWRFAQPGYAFIAQNGALDVSALYGTLTVGNNFWITTNPGLVTGNYLSTAVPGQWVKKIGKAIDAKRILFEFGSPKILIVSP